MQTIRTAYSDRIEGARPLRVANARNEEEHECGYAGGETSGNQRRRFLLHHLPFALASAVILVLFMSLPLFDASVYPHGQNAREFAVRVRLGQTPLEAIRGATFTVRSVEGRRAEQIAVKRTEVA